MTAALLLDTADEVARWLGVKPRTVRSWADRGHITRHPGDRYSAVEAADYLDGRSQLNARKAKRSPRLCTPSRNCVS